MTNACTTVVASRDRCFRPGCDGAVPGGCTAARTDAVGALAGFDAACAAGPVGTCVVGRNDGAVDEIARGAIKQQQQLVVIDEGRVNAMGWLSAPMGNVKNALQLSWIIAHTYFVHLNRGRASAACAVPVVEDARNPAAALGAATAAPS